MSLLVDHRGQPLRTVPRAPIDVPKRDYPLRRFTLRVTYGDFDSWRVPLVALVWWVSHFNRARA